MQSPLYTVDVAHPPRRPGAVEAELMDALEHVRNSSTARILKIVHGYGSSGRGGASRDTARNWAFRCQRMVRAVIEGERYALLDPATQEMRFEVGEYADADLGGQNSGITLVWVK